VGLIVKANNPVSKSAPDSETIRGFYDRFSETRTRNYVGRGNPRIDRAVARVLPLVREDSRVVEIGCGAGLVAEQIARVASRGSVWGCDISPNAIELARTRVHSANVQFRTIDVSQQFEDLKKWVEGPVDLVVGIDVLEHLPLSTHGQFLRNVAAILRQDALVALTFPSPNYQRHLQEHDPAELQVVDEVIELPHLHAAASEHGFVVRHYSLEDVWLPQQYVHCILARKAEYREVDANTAAMADMSELIPPGEKFILVDQDEWRQKAPTDRQAIPFLERGGIYWGPPSDDAAAIAECERLRSGGASFLVVAPQAFWWLTHYAGFNRYLRERHTCVLENEHIVVFRMGRDSK
jgi:2-polyprenyl-3-methyl-5-hydroxy-6-metoxy-1,4-benzoquinol methylase